ncbi:hypothetical protein LQW54_000202 [Pestalotiopsis sp. IQ-011]
MGSIGTTSADGYNWVEYLTLNHNQSAFLTYDYALSGATVNVSIVEGSVGRDVAGEVQNNLLGSYADDSAFVGDNVLYGTWIGINDVKGSYLGDDYEGANLTLYTEIMTPCTRRAVEDYNGKLLKMAKAVRHNLAYARVFYMDTHTLFNNVIADPIQLRRRLATRILTSDSEADSDDGEYAVYEYLLLNNLHPTYPIHNFLAKEVAALLAAGPTF